MCVCVSPFRVPEILIEEIGSRTNIGMFDYNLTRSFFCAFLVENPSRVCLMGVHGDGERRVMRSRVFLKEEVLPGRLGFVRPLLRVQRMLRFSQYRVPLADKACEIASPSGILGVGGGSEVSFICLVSVARAWVMTSAQGGKMATMVCQGHHNAAPHAW